MTVKHIRNTRAMIGQVLLVFCMVGFFMSACVPMTRDHGYVPLPEDVSSLVVGLDTRESVTERLGSPALSALRMNNRMYFVESTVRKLGARRPQVIRREVLALSFDQNDVLRNIERFDLSDGRVVPLEQRVTESIEDHGGFLSSLFRNIGGFSASQLGGAE